MPKAELPPTDDSIFAIMDDIKKRSDFVNECINILTKKKELRNVPLQSRIHSNRT